ncbi:MAG TPA: hypothetical protein VNL71_21535 [Chloroflexota bacterium]|nr:hypothetical protein [Chloroflexota bacterium]
MAAPATTVLDLTPAHLADALDHLLVAVQDADREGALILKTARESLRAVAWNRYAERMNRESRAYRLRRRHQGHQEGRDHA